MSMRKHVAKATGGNYIISALSEQEGASDIYDETKQFCEKFPTKTEMQDLADWAIDKYGDKISGIIINCTYYPEPAFKGDSEPATFAGIEVSFKDKQENNNTDQNKSTMNKKKLIRKLNSKGLTHKLSTPQQEFIADLIFSDGEPGTVEKMIEKFYEEQRYEMIGATTDEAKVLAKSEKKDCAVRALSVLIGGDYMAAHKALKNAGRKEKSGSKTHEIKKAAKELGLELDEMSYDELTDPEPRGYDEPHYYTIKTFAKYHPRGKYLLITTDHAMGLINGEVHSDIGLSYAHVKTAFEIK